MFGYLHSSSYKQRSKFNMKISSNRRSDWILTSEVCSAVWDVSDGMYYHVYSPERK